MDSSDEGVATGDVESTEQKLCDRVEVLTMALNSGDQADVYYPSRRGHHEYPIVAFLQGGLVDKSLYSGFGRELAGGGYIVVIPNHFAALAPPPAPPGLFASQHSVNDVLASMTAADANPASPLHGIVDTTKLGVAGHSFGGAAALYTVEGSCLPPFCFGFFVRPPQLKAAAVYGVNTFNQAGVLLDVNTSAAPSVLIQGANDGRATPARAAATFGIMETPKGLITINGVNHWGIADVQNPPPNTPDPGVQTKSQQYSVETTAKYTQLVFDAYVKGDKGAQKKLRKEKGEHGVNIEFVDN
ncbi:MAG: alpha/beta hydrolase [Polyangiaceae bacterium]